MKNRILRPGFFDNAELAALPFEARLLFAGLWCLADREGRLKDLPPLIKAKIFPYDSISENKIENLLTALEKSEFIHRYTVRNLRLLEIVNFAEHQTVHKHEAASKLPKRQEKDIKPIDVATCRVIYATSTVDVDTRRPSVHSNSTSNSTNNNTSSKSTGTAKEYLSNEELKLPVDEDCVVRLTREDLQSLRENISKLVLRDLIQRLHDYLLQSGKKYKNHRATIRNWHRRMADAEPKPIQRLTVRED